MKLFLSFIVGLLLLGNFTQAQIQNSLFKNYTVQNGLIDERIHCVFQDSKGWIWVGSDYGISRFDAYEFTPLNLYNELSEILKTSLIRTIIEDRKGNIWVGTDIHGAFKYNRNTNKLTQYLSDESVWAIQEDKRGNIWFGTENGLIFYHTKKNAIELKLSAEHGHICGNFIRKIYIDAANRIWVGTQNGITVLNPDNTLFKEYLTGDKYYPLENEIWEIYKDDENQIWVGTYLGGLKKYDASTDSFVNFELDKNNERSLTVRTIVQDKSGDLWFGTRGGLYSFDYASRKISVYENNIKNDYSLIHNSILDLMLDSKGDLWVGTRNGLSFLNFDKKAFGYISANNTGEFQLSNSEVYEIWEDASHSLWIGTESGGVNIVNSSQNKMDYLTVENGLSNNCVKAIGPDNKGNVLIGTYLGGLNQYNPKTGKNRIYKNIPGDSTSISDDAVWDIFTDSKKQIWVATSQGVDIFNPDKGTFIRMGAKFDLGWVVTIHQDKEGNYWFFSTDKNQLTVVYPNLTFKKYAIDGRSLCNDNEGNIWMGTLGDGLVKHNPKLNTFEHFTVDSGLCNNIILGIVNINNEFIWASTNNGVSRFNLKTHQFKNYFISNGLLNAKFNYGAYLLTTDNVLVFGGKKGVDFIFLDQLNDNNFIPPVVITGFKLFNKTVIPNSQANKTIINNLIYEADEINLAYDQNMISFAFSALNFANTDKNSYKYMLEGLDKGWNDIGTLRSANYTNLDHGKYIFKVAGSNSDGVFNEVGKALKIHIFPPFWKTWWFRIIILTLILVLFYTIYLLIINRETLKHQLIFERKSARKLQEVDRLKHQFFMNISHEIKTPLSLITGPLNKLINSTDINESSKSLLAIIQRNTVNLNKLVNQLLDYRKLETGNLNLNLKNGNLRIFIEEIVNSFSGMAEEKKITLNFQVFHQSLFFSFDEDMVGKIMNNLISNAIKYTQSRGNITVSLTIVLASEIDDNNTYIPAFDIEKSNAQSYIKLTVSDTGIGIPDSQIGRIFDRFRRVENQEITDSTGVGIGLALTKELVKLHHGHIKVTSKENKGSKFSVIIPYNKENNEQKHQQSVASNDARDTDTVEESNQNLPLLLIVDDNPDVREFIKHQFEPEYKVYQAKNGKDGWETALEQIPDIIISDVMMPVMDGNELCRKIKGDERTSHIPIIMLTALTSTDQQIAGIDAGADDYLTKPFDVTLLKAKSDNILAIRKSLREKYSKEMFLKPTDVILSNPDEKFLKRLIQIIEKNISKSELDVDLISKNVGVSRTQLYRKLSALTNMTPKEFVRDIRLKRAAQLLIQNKLNISEIADETGFSDISYFRKVFKDKYGMSASEYQKSNS